MSFEVLILLAIFFVLPLVEQLVRNARKKQEQQQGRPPAPPRQAPRPPVRQQPARDAWDDEEDPDDEEPEPVAVSRPVPPPPPLPTVRRAPQPVRRASTAARAAVPREAHLARAAREARMRLAGPEPAELSLARRRRRRMRMAAELSQPAGLRRAVVLMTVLGPCRANEPYS